ncbi:MAG: DHH family phosphoesterase [Candidatus Micrarchaeia archaeon]
MELTANQIEFLEKCEEAKRLAFSFKNPLIVHHYDADGIAAGAIAQNAFKLAGKKYRAKWIKKLDDVAIGELNGEPEIIFCDLGGGNKRVNELKDVLIIDHHQTEGVSKTQVNPLLDGIDGGTELSAAGAAYCVFKNDVDVAIVGAVGDMQHPLTGMNRWVLEQGVGERKIAIENDLGFYGRFSRPLYQFLLYSDDPFVPGISYNEDGTNRLLNELGLADGGNRNAVYGDLKEGEKKKLISALADILLNYNMIEKTEALIGESYVFKNRRRGSETYEANEFSTLLNACGRHGKAEIGVGVCMGDETHSLEAHALLQYHRKKIKEGIEFAQKNIQDFGKFYFLDGRGIIDEGIIGIVCGMAISPMAKKPILGFSLGESNDLKFSSRGTKMLIAKGLNLGMAIKETIAEIGSGAGGGHRIAAGASIPKEKLNEFLLGMGKRIDVK